MGYFVPASADDRLAGPYADYSTALAALRADSSASDGDVYVLNDGRAFKALTGDIGWLLPSRAYNRTSGLVVNATGNAEFTKADDLAAVTGRGWVTSITGVGTVTKSAGAALICSSPNPATSSAMLEFTPTTALTKGLAIFKITGITGGQRANNNLWLYTGAAFFRFTLANGSAGSVGILESFSTVDADAKGNLSTVTAPVWIALEVDNTSTDAPQKAYLLDGDDMLLIEEGDVTNSTVTSKVALYTANTTPQDPAIIQCEEAAAFRYSA